MKKLSIILVLTGLAVAFSSLFAGQQSQCKTASPWKVQKVMKSAGPPSCYAGEPPNNANCTNSGCHDDGVVNTGSATISLDLGRFSTQYIPGDTCTVTVSVSKPGMMRAGFQLVALQDNNISLSPGTIILTDNNRTQVIDKNAPHPGACSTLDKVWIEHTFNGISVKSPGLNSWSFTWRAPAANVGSITFYLAVLESNNDLTESGDHAYTTKQTITSGPVGIDELKKDLFSVYPNPVVNGTIFLKTVYESPLEARLYNNVGRLVAVWQQGTWKERNGIAELPLGTQPGGVYFLSVRTPSQTFTQKVFVDPEE